MWWWTPSALACLDRSFNNLHAIVFAHICFCVFFVFFVFSSNVHEQIRATFQRWTKTIQSASKHFEHVLEMVLVVLLFTFFSVLQYAHFFACITMAPPPLNSIHFSVKNYNNIHGVLEQCDISAVLEVDFMLFCTIW